MAAKKIVVYGIPNCDTVRKGAACGWKNMTCRSSSMTSRSRGIDVLVAGLVEGRHARRTDQPARHHLARPVGYLQGRSRLHGRRDRVDDPQAVDHQAARARGERPCEIARFRCRQVRNAVRLRLSSKLLSAASRAPSIKGARILIPAGRRAGFFIESGSNPCLAPFSSRNNSSRARPSRPTTALPEFADRAVNGNSALSAKRSRRAASRISGP